MKGRRLKLQVLDSKMSNAFAFLFKYFVYFSLYYRIGRKKTVIIYMILSGIACVSVSLRVVLCLEWKAVAEFHEKYRGLISSVSAATLAAMTAHPLQQEGRI